MWSILKKIIIKSSLFTTLFLLIQAPGFASAPNADLSNIFIVDCKTNKNYGLHSYYLFLQQPVFQAHTNALKQTEYLLRKMNKIKLLYSNALSSKQQTVFIPVSFEPQSWVQQPQEADFGAAARWIMHNYDYQCAKTLLKPFPKLSDAGPYLLSSTQKLLPENLSAQRPWRIPVLVQNLSESTPEKSLYWLEMFFKKSWQPRQWLSENLLRLHENMLESLFHYDTQSEESAANNSQIKDNLTDAPQYNVDASSFEDKTTPIFMPLDDSVTEELATDESNKEKPTRRTVDHIDPLKDYPVNDAKPSIPNPYNNLITIEFSADLTESSN